MSSLGSDMSRCTPLSHLASKIRRNILVKVRRLNSIASIMWPASQSRHTPSPIPTPPSPLPPSLPPFLILSLAVSRNLNMHTEKDLPAQNLSPRSRYLRRITQENLTPMPLLLRKENVCPCDWFISLLISLSLFSPYLSRTRKESFSGTRASVTRRCFLSLRWALFSARSSTSLLLTTMAGLGRSSDCGNDRFE
jgi:hypothetical protein